MSRKREAQRGKRHELARQLGVGNAEVEAHRHLQEHARVTRPVVRVVSHDPKRGVFGRLFSKPEHLVLALYLVDANGARLLDAALLDEGERRLDKLTYHRPAHFVIVALSAHEPTPLVTALMSASLSLDDLPIGDGALATAEWETPRAVRIGGLSGVQRGAAVSVRGVARVAERLVMPIGRGAAVVELEI